MRKTLVLSKASLSIRRVSRKLKARIGLRRSEVEPPTLACLKRLLLIRILSDSGLNFSIYSFARRFQSSYIETRKYVFIFHPIPIGIFQSYSRRVSSHNNLEHSYSWTFSERSNLWNFTRASFHSLGTNSCAFGLTSKAESEFLPTTFLAHTHLFFGRLQLGASRHWWDYTIHMISGLKSFADSTVGSSYLETVRSVVKGSCQLTHHGKTVPLLGKSHCDRHYPHEDSSSSNFTLSGRGQPQWAPGIYCLHTIFILRQLNTHCIVNGTAH